MRFTDKDLKDISELREVGKISIEEEVDMAEGFLEARVLLREARLGMRWAIEFLPIHPDSYFETLAKIDVALRDTDGKDNRTSQKDT